jgi:hypothetical protein
VVKRHHRSQVQNLPAAQETNNNYVKSIRFKKIPRFAGGFFCDLAKLKPVILIT